MSTALALRRRAAPTPEAGPLDGDGMPRPIMSHERFAAEAERLTMLRNATHIAKRRLDAIILEQDLSRRGALTQNSSQRDATLRARLAAYRAEIAAAVPPLPVPSAAEPPMQIARALQLLNGHKVEPAPTAEMALADARHAVEVLDAALGAQDVIVDEMRAELSKEVAHALLPQHEEILRSVLEAARGLAAAVAAERAFTATVIVAGYSAPPDILRRPLQLTGAYELGDEQAWDSQLSTFRRALEQRGVIR